MRRTPSYMVEDEAVVRRLIQENPWAALVASTASGLVASHYPIVLEEEQPGISIVSHVGRPDERSLELGSAEMLVIVQGPHGYVSPSWYGDGSFVPTWNHVTAHLYGVPEILSAEENFEVLRRLVDLSEAHVDEPVSLDIDEQAAKRIALGTVGIRIRVTRFDARLKLSQNKPQEVRTKIIEALRGEGFYRQPALAEEMELIE